MQEKIQLNHFSLIHQLDRQGACKFSLIHFYHPESALLRNPSFLFLLCMQDPQPLSAFSGCYSFWQAA